MKSSTFLTLLFLSTLFSVFGQQKNEHFTIANIDQRILYKNYNNHIEFSYPTGFDTVFVRCDEKSTIKSVNSNIVSLKFEKNTRIRTATIYSYGIKEEDTTLLNETSFRVQPMPEPIVFYGSFLLKNKQPVYDSIFFLKNGRCFVRLNDGINLKASFSIKKFNVIINGDTLTNNYSSIQPHIQEKMRLAQKGSKIEFTDFVIPWIDKIFIVKPKYCHIKTSVSGSLKMRKPEDVYYKCDG